MNSTSITLKSLALVHKKLWQMLPGELDLDENRDKLQANSCKDKKSKISTVPKLHARKEHIPHSDFGIPTDDLRQLFARLVKNSYERMLASERGKEILSKAYKYKIPFDPQKIKWLALMDEIHEYEL